MQDNQQENCPSCHKVFNDKSKLKAHERQVHQANPVPCEVCGELQFNKYSLHSHLQIHKEVICDVCQEKCTRKTIARHLRTHQEVKDTYMCGNCDAIFPRKDSLTRHKLMHAMSQEQVNNSTPEKIPEVVVTAKKTQYYHCDQCDYNTTTKRYFSAHTKTHELKGSKIQCNICFHDYSTKSSLSRHMKTIHDVQDNVNILHTDSGFMSFGDDEEIIDSAPKNLKNHSTVINAKKN